MMKYFAGIDLHSNNNVTCVIDKSGAILSRRRLSNDLKTVVHALSPFKESLSGVVVESTYNWYWLVDGLMEQGFKLHLANPAAMKQYEGLKYTDDKSDAAWLANTLRLGILPEGYIYPRDERMLRDLLRKRLQLIHQRTANILSVQNLIARNLGCGLSGSEVQKLTEERVYQLLPEIHLAMPALANLHIIQALNSEVKILEHEIKKELKPHPLFSILQSIHGIGPILAMTILLETGDIHRFAKVGNYASYCRCVESKRTSNNKVKGCGNRKCGNKYLAWAYIEAANFAVRYDDNIQRYYHRKLSKGKRVIAIKTIAHKLARACYWMMRDAVPFQVERAFSS